MTRAPAVARRFLAFLVAATAAFLCVASPAHARQMVSVDRPEINMRTGPGTEHESLWLLARGYPLMVLGRKGNWLQVSDFEGDKGWVYRPLTDRTPHMVVKSKTANIRKGPGTRHKVVAKAEYGAVLRTLGHRNGWAKIRNEAGVVGWVARQLLWGW